MADMTSPLPLPGATAPAEQDFGFGKVVSGQRGYRLLNRDGSYNVRIENGPLWTRFFSYYTFLNVSWPRFFAVFALLYVALNALFAWLFLLGGPDQLQGTVHGTEYLKAFFFSVHTFATVGYGSISPVGTYANWIVTIESMASWVTFALFAGLIFARFSRPVAGIVYSKMAIVAPYNGGMALEFRVVNSKCNPLFNLEALVALSRFEDGPTGKRERKYHTLKLERNKVAFFPLNWTIVHAIEEGSPLKGWTKEMLIAAEAEIFVLITAFDDTYSQTINSRASYTAHEIDFGRRFQLMYHQDHKQMVLDLGKLDSVERAELSA
ncbi:MAG TPA: ion channel [Terriglobales bacterium]|jgi:inward rectifier potassium channel|nr:ion channel [Terriglobales bacterium]